MVCLQIFHSDKLLLSAFAAVFINHIKVNLNQFGPATPLAPPIDKSKVIFFCSLLPPIHSQFPLHTTQNKPHRFSEGIPPHILPPLFLSFLIFSSFFHVFLGPALFRWIQILGRVPLLFLGTPRSYLMQIVPSAGQSRNSGDLFLVEGTIFISCPTTTRLRLSWGRRGATRDKVYLQASICKLTRSATFPFTFN